MNVKAENTEKNVVTLTIEVDEDKFEEGLQKAYMKNVKHITVPGFRKGKAPRKYIEKYYGEGIFYEDAINFICPDAYDKAVEETKIFPVDKPQIDIVEIGTDKKFVFTAKVSVKPEFTLPEYKGIKVDKIEYIPTEKDVDAEIERMREQNASMIVVEDRAIEKDDIAVIDYEGFVDGIAFEGGKGEGHELRIGSGQFIPGFEDQLIGKKSGEETEINVKFPDEYHSEELKGKDATFKVKINSIKRKELPAADDEFAKDVSEFDTIDELRKDILKKMTEEGEIRALRETEDKVLEAIAEKTEIEIPRCMIETQIDRMIEDFGYRLSSQGIHIDQYAEYMGTTVDGLRGQFEVNASRLVKGNLILEKIAEAEEIEATEEEIEKEISKMAEMYKMDVEKIKSVMNGNTDGIAADIKTNKTLEFLVKNASIEKAAPKKTKKKDEEVSKEEAADADEEKKPAVKKTATKTPAKKTTKKEE